MNSVTKVLFFCFLASVQARWVREAHQCAGYEDAPMQFLESTSPDEIHLPGTITMDVHTQILSDLPADLTFKLDLEKQEPFPLEVPCLNGLGSCPYDICSVIEANADSFCTFFPEGQPCGCPLLANDYDMKGITLEVPDFGILNNLMVGSYKSRGTFYGASDPDNKLGCIEFTFTMIQG